MSSYRGIPEGPDQAKAITAVVAVHLRARFRDPHRPRTSRVGDRGRRRLKSSTSRSRRLLRRHPSRVRTKRPRTSRCGRRKAEPSPVVAPPPASCASLPAATTAGSGSASTSGASTAGNGTGAGGSGIGTGGGGCARATLHAHPRPARPKPDRGDYRLDRAGPAPDRGARWSRYASKPAASSNCRVVRSSGDAGIDSSLCPLIEARLRLTWMTRAAPSLISSSTSATWSLCFTRLPPVPAPASPPPLSATRGAYRRP